MAIRTPLMVFALVLALHVASCTESDRESGHPVGGLTQGLAGPSAPIAAVQAWASMQPEVIPDRYIVMLQPNANPAAVARAHALAPSAVYTHVINGFAATIPEPALRGISNNPRVLSVTPIRRMQASGQQVPTGIQRIGGPVSASVNVGIAVIDTGIKQGHEDLNLIASTDCSSTNRKDTTCVDDAGDDVYGHGTHVAGIAAARDNESDVIGVAPGAPLYSVKVLGDDGYGTTETVIKGLDWVASRTDVIGVANMSLSGACVRAIWLVPCDDEPCSSTGDAEHKAICNLAASGVTVVVAAGNDALPATYFSPAAYDEVITVSALADFDGEPGGNQSAEYRFQDCTEDVDDSFACFSNYGADVDIMAPGVGILSTTPTGLEAWSGTSMAAPHVAGAAALYLAANPGAPAAQVRDALIGAGDPTPCADTTVAGFCADDPDAQEPDGAAEPLVSVQQAGCASDEECDDGSLCTEDSCDQSGVCVYTTVSCDDDDACTQDSCDPSTGLCSYQGVVCDDGDACNGIETCIAATGCQPGVPIVCDDANECTDNSCDPATGACSYPPISCDDDDACTEDSCDPASGCVHDFICVCGTNGDACTSNADCCSNKCKRGTCRGN